MQNRILQSLLMVLGGSAMAIGLLVFLLGVEAVSLVETTFDTVVGEDYADERGDLPTLDSELRFYAVFWIAYGIALIWVARALEQRLQFVPLLALLFFVGGLGRVLSLLIVGAPHPMFVVLMVIELVMPGLFVMLYLRDRPDET